MRNTKHGPYRRRVVETEEWYGQPPPDQALGDVDLNREEELDHDLDGADDPEDDDGEDE